MKLDERIRNELEMWFGITPIESMPDKVLSAIKRAILEEIEKMIYSTIPDSSFYKFKMLKALDDIRKLLGEGDSPSNKSKGSGI